MKKHEVFKNNKIVESDKDWRDAFIEEKLKANIEKVMYSLADCIKVNECVYLKFLAPLMSYVTQFENGGLWYNRADLYLATAGWGFDKEATYEDAKQFLKDWKESRK